ncbi:hypothetical protein MML48_9g00001473 [Holotrichia oblita]|uniref:Uncharacterized protein n=1 Tax=Holotrichia oblita TaxID=644536 RepID=A0ACB9SLL0_HOLOL|nr:hypothetical protein MML48_9g00001473 [Holotrichia oblita]
MFLGVWQTSVPSVSSVSSQTSLPSSASFISHNDNEFKKQILTLLEKLFNQNAEIIKYIQANKAHSASKQSLPTLPVSLPLHSEDNLRTLEEYLRLSDESVIALIEYLSTLGGRDTTNKINIILKFLFTDEVASTYSFYGKRLNKKPFHQLILKTVIIRKL